MEATDEIEGLLEVDLDGVGLQVCRGEPLFDVVEFARDPVLLGLQKVERNGPGVVRFEEFGAFVEKSALAGDDISPRSRTNRPTGSSTHWKPKPPKKPGSIQLNAR